MFNTMNVGGQSVTLNTPSHGMLQKSAPESKFIRFQCGSPMEGCLFSHGADLPHITNGHRKTYISVLQVMIFGENQFLVEYVVDEKTGEF